NNPTIKLNINTSDGEVFGEIYIDDPFNEEKSIATQQKSSKEILAILSKSYTNYFIVEGKLTFHQGTIWLFDYRGGQKKFFGKAQIKFKNDRIYFEAVARSYNTIPLNTVLSKT